MAEENQSYLSWTMWTLFGVHAVLYVVTCFILMVFNLMLIKSWRDIWFIWIWFFWGLLLWLNYYLLVFFHGPKWAAWKKLLIDKMKEKIG